MEENAKKSQNLSYNNWVIFTANKVNIYFSSFWGVEGGWGVWIFYFISVKSVHFFLLLVLIIINNIALSNNDIDLLCWAFTA